MLQVKGLSFSFIGQFSLQNINLEVHSGEIIGLIGHSGSGKSTLLHLLAGLKEPDSGEIFINGQKLKGPSNKLIAGHEKIKLVNQQSNLFPNISIFENIAYELRFYKADYQKYRVELLADLLGISHLLNKKPSQVSGGEAQRAMIARALADEPWVLLLDEPVANLDRIHSKQAMLNIVDVVEKENIACIMVTHDVFDAFGVAHRLLILNNGEVVQKGTSEEIYFYPKNKYVAELTGEVNQLNQQYFRPDQVLITENGNYNGIVLKSIFQGAYYENIFKTENGNVVINSPDRLVVGNRYSFDILSIIHFNQ